MPGDDTGRDFVAKSVDGILNLTFEIQYMSLRLTRWFGLSRLHAASLETTMLEHPRVRAVGSYNGNDALARDYVYASMIG